METANGSAGQAAREAELSRIISEITPPDQAMENIVRADFEALAVPPGSLGKLEDIAVQLAGISGERRPSVRKKRIVVLCADNGVYAEGVAGTPQEVTARQAVNMVRGRSGMSVLALATGCEVEVADVGIATPYTKEPDGRGRGILDMKIRPGTGNIAREAAMTRDEAMRAVLNGVSLARKASGEGVDLLGVGEMGIGNTTTSAAVLAALTGRSARDVTGRGAGLPDKAYARKIKVVDRAVRLHFADGSAGARGKEKDPIEVLARVGGLDLAAMCGVYLGCARYHVPAVIDGFISAVAALCAVRLCGDCRGYIFASHHSAERGFRAAMEALGMDAYLHLGLRLGEGSGCPLGFRVMEAACTILSDMATFEEAGIDDDYLENMK